MFYSPDCNLRSKDRKKPNVAPLPRRCPSISAKNIMLSEGGIFCNGIVQTSQAREICGKDDIAARDCNSLAERLFCHCMFPLVLVFVGGSRAPSFIDSLNPSACAPKWATALFGRSRGESRLESSSQESCIMCERSRWPRASVRFTYRFV